MASAPSISEEEEAEADDGAEDDESRETPCLLLRSGSLRLLALPLRLALVGLAPLLAAAEPADLEEMFPQSSCSALWNERVQSAPLTSSPAVRAFQVGHHRKCAQVSACTE